MKYIFILFLGVALFVCSPYGFAQRSNKFIQKSSNSQWYIGIESGINFSQANVLKSYQEFYRPTETITDKAYAKRFAISGQQIALKTAFSPTKRINVSLATAYITYSYGYDQQFVWENAEATDEYVSISYDHHVRLSYLEFPLVARYALVSRGKIRPFVMGGGYYGRLLQANKQIIESGIDRASGGSTSYTNSPNATLVTNIFLNSHAGYLFGGGIEYKPGTVTLTLDVMYKKGLHNITDMKERYSSTRDLPGFGNVQDNIKLDNLQASVSLLFPLKFLTKSFSPITF